MAFLLHVRNDHIGGVIDRFDIHSEDFVKVLVCDIVGRLYVVSRWTIIYRD